MHIIKAINCIAIFDFYLCGYLLNPNEKYSEIGLVDPESLTILLVPCAWAYCGTNAAWELKAKKIIDGSKESFLRRQSVNSRKNQSF